MRVKKVVDGVSKLAFLMAIGLILVISHQLFAEIPFQEKATFYLPFEESATANIAKGKDTPLKEENLTYGQGIAGKSVYIGEGSILSYSTEGNLPSNQEGSISFWVKPKEAWLPEKNYFLFSELVMSEINIMLKKRGRYNQIFGGLCSISTSGEEIRTFAYKSGIGSLSPDTWHHLVMTWNKERVVIYLNGKKIAQAKYGEVKHGLAKGFQIGMRSDYKCKAQAFIDEFIIYNSALSGEEVSEIYKSFKEGRVKTPKVKVSKPEQKSSKPEPEASRKFSELSKKGLSKGNI